MKLPRPGMVGKIEAGRLLGDDRPAPVFVRVGHQHRCNAILGGFAGKLREQHPAQPVAKTVSQPGARAGSMGPVQWRRRHGRMHMHGQGVARDDVGKAHLFRNARAGRAELIDDDRPDRVIPDQRRRLGSGGVGHAAQQLPAELQCRESGQLAQSVPVGAGLGRVVERQPLHARPFRKRLATNGADQADPVPASGQGGRQRGHRVQVAVHLGGDEAIVHASPSCGESGPRQRLLWRFKNTPPIRLSTGAY